MLRETSFKNFLGCINEMSISIATSNFCKYFTRTEYLASQFKVKF